MCANAEASAQAFEHGPAIVRNCPGRSPTLPAEACFMCRRAFCFLTISFHSLRHIWLRAPMQKLQRKRSGKARPVSESSSIVQRGRHRYYHVLSKPANYIICRLFVCQHTNQYHAIPGTCRDELLCICISW